MRSRPALASTALASAALLASAASAVPIGPADLTSAVVEDFEGLWALTPAAAFSSSYHNLPAGFVLPSGLKVRLPEAVSLDGLLLGDFSQASSTYALGANGLVNGSASLRSGTAWAGLSVPAGVTRFSFPSAVSAFGLYISAVSGSITIRALSPNDTVVESITVPSRPVPLDADNFIGLGSLQNVTAIEIEGDFTLFDDIAWQVQSGSAAPIEDVEIVATGSEGFERVAASLPPSAFGSGYRVPPTGYEFPSGLRVVTPDPNDTSGLLIGDFTLGSASYGLLSNGVIGSPADLSDGTAYAGSGNLGRTLGFRFPVAVTEFTVDVSTAGQPLTVRVLDALGNTVAVHTFATTQPVPLGRPYGFRGLSGVVAFEMFCAENFAFDNVRWGTDCEGDLNKDGVKNVFDVLFFFDLFGASCG